MIQVLVSRTRYISRPVRVRVTGVSFSVARGRARSCGARAGTARGAHVCRAPAAGAAREGVTRDG